MRKVFIFAATFLVLAACSKSKEAASPAPEAPAPAPKPEASFKIANATATNDILELRTLTFQNTSLHADSYSWDLSDAANFSDGNVDQPMRYSDKAEPANIYMIPCMRTVTITLTARNKAGDVSVSSQTFNVQCFRGLGGRHPVMHKLY